MRVLTCGLTFLLAMAAVVTACSGSAVDLGGDDADGGPRAAADDDESGSADDDDANRGDSGTASTGPFVEVHVVASHAPTTHPVGTVGQTPITHSLLLKGLTFFANASDDDPKVVLDGVAVETSFDDKADTTIGKAPLSRLPAGHYARARVPVGYAKWSVTGRLHNGAIAVDGRYDSLIAMADGAVLEGAVRALGWTSVVFTTPGVAPVRTETTNPLPQPPSDSPFKLVSKNGQAYYEFPVDLTVEALDHDVKAVLRMNTHEDFRWVDAPTIGYAVGVWDTTPSGYETVVGFGANSATLTIED